MATHFYPRVTDTDAWSRPLGVAFFALMESTVELAGINMQRPVAKLVFNVVKCLGKDGLG